MPEAPYLGLCAGETFTITCAFCHRRFDVEQWVIIDIIERPDLLEQMLDSGLRNVICPGCNASWNQKTPLLVLRPQQGVPPMMCLAEGVGHDEGREKAQQLLELLKERLGNAWQDEWDLGDVKYVSRDTLEDIISSGDRFHGQGRDKLESDMMTLGATDVRTSEAQQTKEAYLNLSAFGEEFRGEIVDALFDALATANTETRTFGQLFFDQLIRRPALLEQLAEKDDELGVLIRLMNEAQQAVDAENDFERTSDLFDLENAIAVWERILNRHSPSELDQRVQINMWLDAARDYLRRYQMTGERTDLDQALTLCQQAYHHLTPDDPEFPRALGQFGACLATRYDHTGLIGDLEDAIQAFEQCVETTQLNSVDQAVVLTNLGAGLWKLYQRTGRLADLDKALHASQLAAKLIPSDSPDVPNKLNTLGLVMLSRYHHTEDLRDLQGAISVLEEMVNTSPTTQPNRPRYMASLGNALFDRFGNAANLPDLEKAIELWREAVGNSPINSSILPSLLGNLAVGLTSLFEHTEHIDYLQEAIEVYHQAIETMPSVSPDYPALLHNFASAILMRHKLVENLDDLNAALDSWRKAIAFGLVCNPHVALRAANTWGNWAFENRIWDGAIVAYGYAYEAIDVLIRSQLRRVEKESWLRETRGLSARYAYALAQTGDMKRALTVLEIGTARLLTEALGQSNRDLERLATLGHNDLLERYRRVMNQLELLKEQLPQSIFLSEPLLSPSRLSSVARRKAENTAQADLNDVVVAIQKVAGFEDWKNAPAFEKIQKAVFSNAPRVYLQSTPDGRTTLTVRPLDAPLVYLVTTAVGSLGLILRSSQGSALANTPPVVPVWFEGLTEERLQEVLRIHLSAYAQWLQDPEDSAARTSWLSGLDQTTRWLWEIVMGPLLWELSTETAIQLIPTGLLGQLPLHASWHEDSTTPTGRRYALDVLRITYAPNAQALMASRPAANLTTPDSLLAVGNPDGSLRFSDQEVAAISAYFSSDRARVLCGAAATRQAVLDQLPEFQICHFSTHGRASRSTPLKSGLLLADNNELTLADILDLRLEKSRLAVLSACETSIPGSNLPDEVISLPTGLVQAGMPGVVGSLWAVRDLSTTMLMERFYRLWRQEGLPPAEALRGAQRWLRDSTNREKRDYFKRFLSDFTNAKTPSSTADTLYKSVVLAEDDALDFAHPFHWAAFTYTGA